MKKILTLGVGMMLLVPSVLLAAGLSTVDNDGNISARTGTRHHVFVINNSVEIAKLQGEIAILSQILALQIQLDAAAHN